MTVHDVLSQWDDIRQHPSFEPGFTYLTDLTEVTEYKISTTELKELVRTNDPFDPTARRIVVAPTNFLFGMVRMYEMSGDLHPRLTAVRTMDEAISLLQAG
jgi:hypothetical protein